MRLPNLLATRRGRLTAFFFLYITEGIPLGFAATAVATQLRRQDVGPAAIGAFVASFYLPWAFKWAFGPFIDVFASDRLGRRRGWIIITQLLMVITLLSTVTLELPRQLALFTAILLVHNTFGAMQDVAIDAMAVNTLHADERGVANGLMFSGAYLGNMLGGSGVLFLTGVTGFQPTFFFVAGAILLVTVLIALPMREPPGPARAAVSGSKVRAAGREMAVFAIDSFKSFLGTRGAFAGLFFSLLPPGAMSLGLALQSNLAVEMGMNDDEVAWLQLWSALLTAGFCVVGGLWSDRFGRRRMLFVYIALMCLPVLYLMTELQRAGWIMPVSQGAAQRPALPQPLLIVFWAVSLVYALLQGLMYGTRSAALMDVTNPRVAATQFTAYMALANLAIAYSANWQGIAIEAWGYPRTLLIDALMGMLCLLFIPFLREDSPGQTETIDSAAPLRARALAAGLGIGCLLWLPYAHARQALGAGQPIANTFFTLMFIGSALFLLAGGSVVRTSHPLIARLAAWTAPLLLAMHARHHVDSIARALAAWWPADTTAATLASVFQWIAIAGGALLLALAVQPWRELAPRNEASAATS